jgi:transposase
MSDQYWLSEAQLDRIKPYFPRSHGRPRVDRRVISGIVHVIRNGLGGMRLRSMGHTRRYTTASCVSHG